MVVIKGKEKVLNKPLSPANAKLSEKSKRKLKRPQDNQPIATVCV
jgi:hypothetical protein